MLPLPEGPSISEENNPNYRICAEAVVNLGSLSTFRASVGKIRKRFIGRDVTGLVETRDRHSVQKFKTNLIRRTTKARKSHSDLWFGYAVSKVQVGGDFGVSGSVSGGSEE